MYIDKNKEMRVCVFYLFSNENVVYQLNISMQIDMPHLILSESLPPKNTYHNNLIFLEPLMSSSLAFFLKCIASV